MSCVNIKTSVLVFHTVVEIVFLYMYINIVKAVSDLLVHFFCQQMKIIMDGFYKLPSYSN